MRPPGILARIFLADLAILAMASGACFVTGHWVVGSLLVPGIVTAALAARWLW